MKSLSVVYNKNRDEQPIKSSQPATQIAIDNRNNIYISLGSEIRVFSLRRLSKMKDFIIDIIKMQQVITKKVDLEPDDLTTKFNDSEVQLLELKSYLIEDQQQNKLLQSFRLKQRIVHLNQQYLCVKTFQLSKTKGQYPNISVLLTTRHLVTLINNGKGYHPASRKSISNVRAFKHLKQNVLAIVTDKIIIKQDTNQNKQLGKIKIFLSAVNLMEVVNISSEISKIIIADFTQLKVITLQKYSQSVVQTVKTPQSLYYIQLSSIDPNIIYLASFIHVWSMDISITNKDIIIHKQNKLEDQKLLLHDSITPYTTLSYKQNSITKLLIQTPNGVYISFTYDTGRSYKELDLIAAVPNQYLILKWCLVNIKKSLKDEERNLNFHDLRVIQNKQVVTELEKIALILKDNDLSELGKDKSQKSINRDILKRAKQVANQLQVTRSELDIICQKFLLHILIISGQNKRQTFKEQAIDIIRRKCPKKEVKLQLLQKRCIFSFEKLKDDLVECIQCKLLGNKKYQKQQKRCYICWGEFDLIQQI